jgi:tol-pal system protein YbgF
MKPAWIFVTGMLAGILLTSGAGILFRDPGHSGGSVPSLLPAGLPAGLLELGRDAADLLRGMREPAPAVLRRPVTGSLRMVKSGVVLTQSLPSPTQQANSSAPAQQGSADVPVAPVAPAAPTESVPSAGPAAVAPPAGPAGTPVVAKAGVAERTPSPAKAKAKRGPSAQGPDEAYARALRDYEGGRHAQGRERFAAFIQAFPQHRLVPNALYWTGETWYAQGRYDRAAEAFARVQREHPRHAKSADALLKLAYAALRQGDANKARSYLNELDARYPHSPASRLGRQARARLQGSIETGMLVAGRG